MRYVMGAGLCAMVALAGCEVPQPQTGQKAFVENCSICHGRSGRGDGTMAPELPAAPTDLTRIALRDDGGFPYERVMATIYGYPDKYHSSAMPEFGSWQAGPQVMWRNEAGKEVATPKALVEIVEYLASIQQG